MSSGHSAYLIKQRENFTFLTLISNAAAPLTSVWVTDGSYSGPISEHTAYYSTLRHVERGQQVQMQEVHIKGHGNCAYSYFLSLQLCINKFL
jgi:hypothetical protein